ncbi:MAG: hypothetical protein R3E01_33725 [Pirellulaceae bacterium]
MDRLQQIDIWKTEFAEREIRINALKADIEANPMDPEVLRHKREEYEAESERQWKATPPDVIFFEPGPPPFDGRIEELGLLESAWADLACSIEEYSERRLPDGTTVDEATFAREHGLDLPPPRG